MITNECKRSRSASPAGAIITAVLLFLLWAGCAGLWVLFLLFDGWIQFCELELGSGSPDTYGTATWSWFPPGTACTYNLTDYTGSGGSYTYVDEPSLARVVVCLLLILWPLAMALLILTRPQRWHCTAFHHVTDEEKT